jgi:hypothetical protein
MVRKKSCDAIARSQVRDVWTHDYYNAANIQCGSGFASFSAPSHGVNVLGVETDRAQRNVDVSCWRSWAHGVYLLEVEGVGYPYLANSQLCGSRFTQGLEG